MKAKLLLILHRSPPMHGAAKVGDFIGNSEKLKEEFECKFITIKSAETISDIGKINLKKIYYFVELYIKVLYTLFTFRPNKLYYTSSIHGVAFYRDLLISSLWKIYRSIFNLDVYLHYHVKGINNFVSSSKKNLLLTQFFLQNVFIVILSPMLKNDFEKVNSYKNILYLHNGVENNLSDLEFENYILKKSFGNEIHILYISNMILSKGYFEVLKLAKKMKYENCKFHFAGGWQNEDDKSAFFQYIKKNHLENIVTFHGFVNGEEKKSLFKQANIFVFPTRYENEAFPLSILEAFSYGIPVLSTDEGAIPSMIDVRSGVVLNNLDLLPNIFEKMLNSHVNIETAQYCREYYLKKFTLNKFEQNLVEIFK